MSAAVFCDECGRIVPERDVVRCHDAYTSDGKHIYGADICIGCLPMFDEKHDAYGCHLAYKKEDKESAK